MQVEDHELAHAGYEGREGRHAKLVWDAGVLTDLTERDGTPVGLRDAIEAGHLKVRLDGHKLAGAFALTRTRMGGEDRNWLLVKVDDDQADPSRDPVAEHPESVLTGRTLDQLPDQSGPENA